MAWYLHAVCILALLAAALNVAYIFLALIREIRKGRESETEQDQTKIAQEDKE